MRNCPFCNHDPYHYVDIGVGYEAVAVTCCELGIALFDRREKSPEEITLTWDEFTGVADTITRLRSELDQARGMVERLEIQLAAAQPLYSRRELLKKLEYALTKDSLIDSERIESALAVIRHSSAITSTEGKPDAWDAAHGCAPNATGDLSSEDFIRKMRDEEWPEPPVASTDGARPKVIGRVTGKEYDGDQVAGMPGAICHACGLKDYPCVNPDCPNKAAIDDGERA